MKIEIKEEDLPKKRSGLIVAMQRRGHGRHSHKGKMRDRRMRRAKDARKHWSKEWE
jgi:hypothetical protein